MTAEQAVIAVNADFRRPIPVGLPGQTFYASPPSSGGVPLVAPAVEQAFAAEPGGQVPLKVLVDRPRLAAASTRFAAELTAARGRCRGSTPRAPPGRPARAIRASR